MYTVSIYSQTTNQWRETTETTLAAAVALTLGLATHWLIRWTETHPNQYGEPITLSQRVGTAQPGNKLVPLAMTWTTGYARRKYHHAKRSLICRWIARLANARLMTTDEKDTYRWLYRLSDRSLLNQLDAQGYAIEHPRS